MINTVTDALGSLEMAYGSVYFAVEELADVCSSRGSLFMARGRLFSLVGK